MRDEPDAELRCPTVRSSRSQKVLVHFEQDGGYGSRNPCGRLQMANPYDLDLSYPAMIIVQGFRDKSLPYISTLPKTCWYQF
jgi:hypothetical protein